MDDEETVRKRVNKAEFLEGEKDNGIMALLKYFIFIVKKDRKEKFIVERPDKYGGTKEYADYDSLEKDVLEKKMHPMDIKQAVAKDINRLLENFRKDSKCRVIIGNPQSAGLGVNLVEADYSIYFSKNFSLEADLQSEARNHRGGSDIHDKITRIDLVAMDTIDVQVTEALRNKQNIADAILDWDL